MQSKKNRKYKSSQTIDHYNFGGTTKLDKAGITQAVGGAAGTLISGASNLLEGTGADGQKFPTAGSDALRNIGATMPLATTLAGPTMGLSFAIPAIAGIIGAITGGQKAKEYRREEKSAAITAQMQQTQNQYMRYGGQVKKYADGGEVKTAQPSDMQNISTGYSGLIGNNTDYEIDPSSIVLPEVLIQAKRIYEHNTTANTLNYLGANILHKLLTKEDNNPKTALAPSQIDQVTQLFRAARQAERSNLANKDIRDARGVVRREGFMGHAAYGGDQGTLVQAEKGEKILTYDPIPMITDVNAKVKHSKLPPDLPTERLDKHKYIFSALGKTSEELKLIASISGLDLDIANKFGGKGKQSPATIAQNAYNTVAMPKTKSYTFKTPERNAAKFKDIIPKLIAFNDGLNPEKALPQFANNPAFSQIPHAAYGGDPNDDPNYYDGRPFKDGLISPVFTQYDAEDDTQSRMRNGKPPGYNDMLNEMYKNALARAQQKQNSNTSLADGDKNGGVTAAKGDATGGVGTAIGAGAAAAKGGAIDFSSPKGQKVDPASIMYGLNLFANLLNRPQKMYPKAMYDTTSINNMRWEQSTREKEYSILSAQSAASRAVGSNSNWKNYAANATNIASNTQSALNAMYAANEGASNQLYNAKMAQKQQAVAAMFQNTINYNVDKTAVANANRQRFAKDMQAGVKDTNTYMGEMLALSDQQRLLQGLIGVIGPNGIKELIERMGGITSEKTIAATTSSAAGTPSSSNGQPNFVGPIIWQ